MPFFSIVQSFLNILFGKLLLVFRNTGSVTQNISLTCLVIVVNILESATKPKLFQNLLFFQALIHLNNILKSYITSYKEKHHVYSFLEEGISLFFIDTTKKSFRSKKNQSFIPIEAPEFILCYFSVQHRSKMCDMEKESGELSHVHESLEFNKEAQNIKRSSENLNIEKPAIPEKMLCEENNTAMDQSSDHLNTEKTNYTSEERISLSEEENIIIERNLARLNKEKVFKSYLDKMHLGEVKIERKEQLSGHLNVTGTDHTSEEKSEVESIKCATLQKRKAAENLGIANKRQKSSDSENKITVTDSEFNDNENFAETENAVYIDNKSSIDKTLERKLSDVYVEKGIQCTVYFNRPTLQECDTTSPIKRNLQAQFNTSTSNSVNISKTIFDSSKTSTFVRKSKTTFDTSENATSIKEILRIIPKNNTKPHDETGLQKVCDTTTPEKEYIFQTKNVLQGRTSKVLKFLEAPTITHSQKLEICISPSQKFPDTSESNEHNKSTIIQQTSNLCTDNIQLNLNKSLSTTPEKISDVIPILNENSSTKTLEVSQLNYKKCDSSDIDVTDDENFDDFLSTPEDTPAKLSVNFSAKGTIGELNEQQTNTVLKYAVKKLEAIADKVKDVDVPGLTESEFTELWFNKLAEINREYASSFTDDKPQIPNFYSNVLEDIACVPEKEIDTNPSVLNTPMPCPENERFKNANRCSVIRRTYPNLSSAAAIRSSLPDLNMESCQRGNDSNAFGMYEIGESSIEILTYDQNYRPWPGQAFEPDKVKKDARYQKKFYKQKREGTSPKTETNLLVQQEHISTSSASQVKEKTNKFMNERFRRKNFSHITGKTGGKKKLWDRRLSVDVSCDADMPPLELCIPKDFAIESAGTVNTAYSNSSFTGEALMNSSKVLLVKSQIKSLPLEIIELDHRKDENTDPCEIFIETGQYSRVNFRALEDISISILFVRDRFYEPTVQGGTHKTSIPLITIFGIEFEERYYYEHEYSPEEFLHDLRKLENEYYAMAFFEDPRILEFFRDMRTIKIPLKPEYECSSDYELNENNLVRCFKSSKQAQHDGSNTTDSLVQSEKNETNIESTSTSISPDIITPEIIMRESPDKRHRVQQRNLNNKGEMLVQESLEQQNLCFNRNLQSNYVHEKFASKRPYKDKPFSEALVKLARMSQAKMDTNSIQESECPIEVKKMKIENIETSGNRSNKNGSESFIFAKSDESDLNQNLNANHYNKHCEYERTKTLVTHTSNENEVSTSSNIDQKILQIIQSNKTFNEAQQFSIAEEESILDTETFIAKFSDVIQKAYLQMRGEISSYDEIFEKGDITHNLIHDSDNMPSNLYPKSNKQKYSLENAKINTNENEFLAYEDDEVNVHEISTEKKSLYYQPSLIDQMKEAETRLYFPSSNSSNDVQQSESNELKLLHSNLNSASPHERPKTDDASITNILIEKINEVPVYSENTMSQAMKKKLKTNTRGEPILHPHSALDHEEASPNSNFDKENVDEGYKKLKTISKNSDFSIKGYKTKLEINESQSISSFNEDHELLKTNLEIIKTKLDDQKPICTLADEKKTPTKEEYHSSVTGTLEGSSKDVINIGESFINGPINIDVCVMEKSLCETQISENETNSSNSNALHLNKNAYEAQITQVIGDNSTYKGHTDKLIEPVKICTEKQSIVDRISSANFISRELVTNSELRSFGLSNYETFENYSLELKTVNTTEHILTVETSPLSSIEDNNVSLMTTEENIRLEHCLLKNQVQVDLTGVKTVEEKVENKELSSMQEDNMTEHILTVETSPSSCIEDINVPETTTKENIKMEYYLLKKQVSTELAGVKMTEERVENDISSMQRHSMAENIHTVKRSSSSCIEDSNLSQIATEESIKMENCLLKNQASIDLTGVEIVEEKGKNEDLSFMKRHNTTEQFLTVETSPSRFIDDNNISRIRTEENIEMEYLLENQVSTDLTRVTVENEDLSSMQGNNMTEQFLTVELFPSSFIENNNISRITDENLKIEYCSLENQVSIDITGIEIAEEKIENEDLASLQGDNTTEQFLTIETSPSSCIENNLSLITTNENIKMEYCLIENQAPIKLTGVEIVENEDFSSTQGENMAEHITVETSSTSFIEDIKLSQMKCEENIKMEEEFYFFENNVPIYSTEVEIVEEKFEKEELSSNQENILTNEEQIDHENISTTPIKKIGINVSVTRKAKPNQKEILAAVRALYSSIRSEELKNSDETSSSCDEKDMQNKQLEENVMPVPPIESSEGYSADAESSSSSKGSSDNESRKKSSVSGDGSQTVKEQLPHNLMENREIYQDTTHDSSMVDMAFRYDPFELGEYGLGFDEVLIQNAGNISNREVLSESGDQKRIYNDTKESSTQKQTPDNQSRTSNRKQKADFTRKPSNEKKTSDSPSTSSNQTQKQGSASKSRTQMHTAEFLSEFKTQERASEKANKSCKQEQILEEASETYTQEESSSEESDFNNAMQALEDALSNCNKSKSSSENGEHDTCSELEDIQLPPINLETPSDSSGRDSPDRTNYVIVKSVQEYVYQYNSQARMSEQQNGVNNYNPLPEVTPIKVIFIEPAPVTPQDHNHGDPVSPDGTLGGMLSWDNENAVALSDASTAKQKVPGETATVSGILSVTNAQKVPITENETTKSSSDST